MAGSAKLEETNLFNSFILGPISVTHSIQYNTAYQNIYRYVYKGSIEPPAPSQCLYIGYTSGYPPPFHLSLFCIKSVSK